jgi:hypothetical protein
MYNYKLRPGYQSKLYLIEFFLKEVDDEFLETFILSLESLHPKQIKVTDVWVNDEIVIEFDSDIGVFEMNIDNYGEVFIMAPNNQQVIVKIDEILNEDENFSKLVVDLDEYN